MEGLVRRRGLDVALAVVLAVLAQVAVAEGRVAGEKWALAVLYLLVGPPLLLRRTRPLAAQLALCTAFVVQSVATQHSPEGAYLVMPLLVSTYSLAAYATARASAAGLVATVVALSIHAAFDPFIRTPAEVWSAAFWELLQVAVAVLGFAVAGRRRAVREALRAADLESRQESAILEERRRIARELHDVISHHVSASVIQAVAAQGVLTADPEAARLSLQRVESSNREAMSELRRLLGVMRGTDDEDELSPQPSLSGLGALVQGVHDVGLPVTLEVRGDASEVPAGLGLTTYRIVQEALTNVVRHASASSAQVTISLDEHIIDIEVRDDGRGGSEHRSGHGLLGMRERVAAFNGSLAAGPLAAGGFGVHARLSRDDAS